jgi:hypothetical protein
MNNAVKAKKKQSKIITNKTKQSTLSSNLLCQAELVSASRYKNAK